jgi:hypothetical protein
VAGVVGRAGVAVVGDASAVVGVVALLDDELLPQEDKQAAESVAAIRATSTEPRHGRRFMTTVLGST